MGGDQELKKTPLNYMEKNYKDIDSEYIKDVAESDKGRRLNLVGQTLRIVLDDDADNIGELFLVDNDAANNLINNYEGLSIAQAVKEILLSEVIPDNYKIASVFILGSIMLHHSIKESDSKKTIDESSDLPQEIFKGLKLH